MASQTSGFLDHEDEYNSLFQVFGRGRLEQQQVWVDEELIPKLAKSSKLGEPVVDSELRVLAVGSGIGAFDCLLIEALQTRAAEFLQGRQIIWTVVEPNASAIEKFKERIASKSALFEKVKFIWMNESIEDFLSSRNSIKYHFIHFMHVLYYVDAEKALRNAYELCLENQGCMLVAVGSKNDIWVNLIESFKSKIPSLTSELTYPTNVVIGDIAKRNGWQYDMFVGKLDLEVTELFEEGNPQGEGMLQFFLHINEDARKKYGREVVSDVIDFFKGMSWETGDGDKKKAFVNDNEGLLLIYKAD